jgi:RNA-directed DNA polymerase
MPTIRDRVAQTAAVLVLQPIFEADFLPALHGYREGRAAHGAVEEVKESLRSGMTEVVDADLSRYFDTIPHDQLMQSLARRIVDRQMLALLKTWLVVPVEERDDWGRPRMSGGKGAKQGVPQGGPLGPLLANIYINRLAKAFARRAEQFRARLVNYADDFVILSRGRAREILAWVRLALARTGLALNEAKTSVRDARTETFDFLGFTLGRQKSQRDGRWCYPSTPSKRSVRRFKENINRFLVASNTDPWESVAKALNRKIRGWAAYFRFGAYASAFRALDRFVANRARHFLRRRHKVSSRGTRRFGREKIYSEFGVVSLVMLGKAARS